MRYLSVCSGIEAATVAWHSLGWQPVAFSEIEPFPSAVLAHHYPDVPNVGDMTKFKEWDIGPIDLLVGGTPCQSFSVAGLRKGLEDPRGNLALTYVGILNRFKPKWFIWENVPGVLSSGGGRDFGSFLGALGQIGYGFAYRVLDAQYFGVAQRRRRVFVVGCLGDWRSAAEVLFEPESMCGNPAPSREKGQEVAGTIAARFGISRNNHEECVIAKCLTRGIGQRLDAETETMVAIALAENTIGRQPQNGGNGDGFTVGGPMCTLNATGVHGVAQAIPLDLRNASRDPEKHDAVNRQGVGVGEPGDPAHTVTTACVHGVAHPIGIFQDSEYGVAKYDSAGTLRAGRIPEHQMVMQPMTFSGQMSNPQVDMNISATLQAKNPMAVAHPIGCDLADTLTVGANQTTGFIGDVVAQTIAPTLTASNDPSRSPQSTEVTNQVAAVHAASMAVRRLTPIECERLQGFPDNYTNIPWRKQPESPDGPRYKALGNSMAVPVMKWIGSRIHD
jgi:DNA (cytosine-5)-methyltransferase 1